MKDNIVYGLKGLCFRCEHRSRYFEDNNYHPRFECGNIKISVYSCYMYEPVHPVILECNKGDKRPIEGPYMITARCHSLGVAAGKIKIYSHKNEFIKYWKMDKIK